MTWRPWQQAWQDALYGPCGFYRRPEGPAGHFATSAQGIPGVGVVLARAIAALAAQHGLRAVADVGAGRGELLSELHRLDPSLSLTGVDVVPRPDGLPSSCVWLESPGGPELPDVHFEDVLVVAHEWLDVVPTPVAEVDEDGVLRQVEVEVAVNGTGQLTERLADEVDPSSRGWAEHHWSTAETGHRVEIGLSRDEAWESLCSTASRGLVVAVDYGHRASERPPYGTLTGFRHGTEVSPVPDGSSDLTAHVAVDSLAADRSVRQADLFRELDLVPPAPELQIARTDPPAYLAALSARSAAIQAVARPGLGDFWWVLRRV